MEIFFIKNDKKYTSPSEKRQQEHILGRYILDFTLKNFYKIQKFNVLIKNKKPYIENNPIYFSISHSKEIVAISFDIFPVGFDIEYMKPIDLKKMSVRYKTDFKTIDSFYEFWTKYEAGIKLQEKSLKTFNFNIFESYKAATASIKNFSKIQIYEIKDEKFNYYQECTL